MTNPDLIKTLGLTASILLIASGLFYWIKTRPDLPATIFNENFEPYSIPASPRSMTNMSDDFILAVIHYGDGEYDLAIHGFENTIEDDPDNYTAILLVAISHMATMNFTAAEPHLQTLVEDSSHVFHDIARWYLGLLFLSDENTANDHLSDVYFDEISDVSLIGKIKQIR